METKIWKSFSLTHSRMSMYFNHSIPPLGIWSTMYNLLPALDYPIEISHDGKLHSLAEQKQEVDAAPVFVLNQNNIYIQWLIQIQKGPALPVCGSLSWKALVTSYLQRSQTEVLKTLTFSFHHLILISCWIEGEAIFFIFFPLVFVVLFLFFSFSKVHRTFWEFTETSGTFECTNLPVVFFVERCSWISLALSLHNSSLVELLN